MERIMDVMLEAAGQVVSDSEAMGPAWLQGRVFAEKRDENTVAITAAGKGAFFYEMGSGRQAARPFLYPAYRARRDEIVAKAGQAALDAMAEELTDL